MKVTESKKPQGPGLRSFCGCLMVLLLSLALPALYSDVVETVPYTGRKHIVLVPMRLERLIGRRMLLAEKMAKYRDKILPDTHPDSVRVGVIVDRVINGLERGMGEKHRWRKLGSDSDRRSADGLNWEVFVVDDPEVKAFCLPGGKILVSAGFLSAPETDDNDIAFVLAHEVGHIVARHGIEISSVTAPVRLILSSQAAMEFSRIYGDSVSKRMEAEADHIGLLLMASAGYDPRLAVDHFEKLGRSMFRRKFGDSTFTPEQLDRLRDGYGLDEGDCFGDSITHPCPQQRIRYLSQDKIMKKALAIYREAVNAPLTNRSAGPHGLFDAKVHV